MVRRDTRKNILRENSEVEEELEEEDDSAKEDEIFLLESLQGETANSKVVITLFVSVELLSPPGEADSPDQADRCHHGAWSGHQDCGGGGWRPYPYGDKGAKT